MLAALSSWDLTELAAFYELEDELRREAELRAAATRPVASRGHRMGG